MEKISPWSVVTETMSLAWARKWTYLGLSLSLFLPIAPGVGFFVSFSNTTGVDAEFDPGLLVGSMGGLFLFSILCCIFMMTVMSHLAVTQQRGQAKVLPPSLIKSMWDVFCRMIVLVFVSWGIMMLAMMVLMIPMAIGSVFLIGKSVDEIGAEAVWLVLSLLVVMIPVYAILCRPYVMIPGAAVGVRVTVSKAFEMTKGHMWRMFASYLVLLVPGLLCMLVAEVAEALAPDADSWILAVVVIPVLLLCCFSYAWMGICDAVWFEKLRLRHNAMILARRAAREKEAAESEETQEAEGLQPPQETLD